jgi:aspartate/methionine/tyrosine aminotransferase
VNPGDESVIPVPSWSTYALMTKLADGEPVFVTCPQNNGFGRCRGHRCGDHAEDEVAGS